MRRKIRHHNIPTDFHAASETEALILEQALAFYREIKTVTENAPDGQVLAQAEAVCLLKGREFLRKSLELTVQEQIDELEKKHETAKRAKRKNDIADTHSELRITSIYHS